jgi:murein DD-endopeptidase MepM/ murein hydrolase activator NlpD
MNIILFTGKGGQVWNFQFNLLRSVLFSLAGLLSLCAALFYAGQRLGERDLSYMSDWQDEMLALRYELDRARESAGAHLNALTLRVGQIQAQLLRLNALGERLVRQGDIDAEEFRFDELPAVGGPQEAAVPQSIEFPDFLAMLDELRLELDDREQKLSVLETLLMDRSLRERVMPSGRPVESGWLSSEFGKRADPFTGKQEHHRGVDFAGKEGTGVVSVGAGIVTWSGRRSGYGNLVEITHGNGYVTRYAHNSEQLVAVGDTVSKGQLIARMGSTGRSTGPHVHFEVLRHGKAVNPSKYLTN